MPNFTSFSRSFSLVAITALAACASSPQDGQKPSKDQASHTFQAAGSRLESAAGKVGQTAGLTGNVSLSVPCGTSGTLAVSGTYDGGTAGTKLTLDADFQTCKEPAGTIDGTLHWTGDVSPAGTANHWTGTLDFTDPTGAWSCSFDFTLKVDATGPHRTGTICGYDVGTL